MIFYGYWRSSAAYRVRIALALKGLVAEHRPIDLRSAEQRSDAFLALNPGGLVPLLVDGAVRIAQSLAIIEYLDERQPAPSLLPGDAARRARIRAAALTIACDIHPLNNLRVLTWLKAEAGLAPPLVDGWAQHWITTGLAALEPLAAVSPGSLLFGDTPTLADVCLLPQLYSARRFGVDLAAFPALVAAAAALAAWPGIAATAPEMQADAMA